MRATGDVILRRRKDLVDGVVNIWNTAPGRCEVISLRWRLSAAEALRTCVLHSADESYVVVIL